MTLGKWLVFTSSTILSVALTAIFWFSVSATSTSSSATSQTKVCVVTQQSSANQRTISVGCEQFESVTASTQTSTQSNPTSSRPTHRSLSFHYLDVLEFLFGGNEQKQISRANSSPQSSL